MLYLDLPSLFIRFLYFIVKVVALINAQESMKYIMELSVIVCKDISDIMMEAALISVVHMMMMMVMIIRIVLKIVYLNLENAYVFLVMKMSGNSVYPRRKFVMIIVMIMDLEYAFVDKVSSAEEESVYLETHALHLVDQTKEEIVFVILDIEDMEIVNYVHNAHQAKLSLEISVLLLVE